MAKSMTGFGRGEYEDEFRSVSVELRSVNHRYSDINVRLPRMYQFAEDSLKSIVKEYAPRGKVDLFVYVENAESEDVELQLNLSLAKNYSEILSLLKSQIPGLGGEFTLDMIASFPDVIRTLPAQQDEEKLLEALTQAARTACENLLQMKIAEGAELSADILERNELIEKIVDDIEIYSPEVVKDYVQKMKDRIRELIEGEAELPEDRILLEAAVFADKSNITEELVRLRSHCAQMREIFRNEDEQIGKKLDFLVQEMNREVNTIGSKASDIRITSDVLALKAEIEKIREQVQNIE